MGKQQSPLEICYEQMKSAQHITQGQKLGPPEGRVEVRFRLFEARLGLIRAWGDLNLGLIRNGANLGAQRSRN